MFWIKLQLVDFVIITTKGVQNFKIKGEKNLKKMFLPLTSACILEYFYILRFKLTIHFLKNGDFIFCGKSNQALNGFNECDCIV